MVTVKRRNVGNLEKIYMIRKMSEADAALSFQLHKYERHLFRFCASLCLGKNCVSFE